jgi:ubiquinol-cytochrome c reductase cytochrome b subunit
MAVAGGLLIGPQYTAPRLRPHVGASPQDFECNAVAAVAALEICAAGSNNGGHAECMRALRWLMAWVDSRFPATRLWNEQWGHYIAPKNFNVLYFFGSLAALVLVIQIVTGIFLAMHYKPDAALAFESVEYIMRDVPWGWLIRYVHSTGASAFFIVVYLHMFRGIVYGSHRKPRELVWIFGCLIFLCLMAEAFFGYLLPWGQMSYWGAQVIVNLFAAVPMIGPDLALLIRGDYVVGDATLNRFYAFHVVAVPLVLVGLVAAHLMALHEVGSNNPDGIEIKERLGHDGKPLDGIPSHPYYTVHDIFGVSVFLLIFSAVVFFAPEFGGYFLEYNNFIPADPLKTPPHIAPVWYFTPYYSMLRATTDVMVNVLAAVLVLAGVLGVFSRRLGATAKIVIVIGVVLGVVLLKTLDAKFWGVVMMGGAVVILFFLPWLDASPVKSIRYRPRWHALVVGVFVFMFLVLGYLGSQPPSDAGNIVSQVGTLGYFAFFLLMPWWSRLGTFRPVPEGVTYKPH